ncbi:MAG: MarR family transcriptional regulator [bacterium]
MMLRLVPAIHRATHRIALHLEKLDNLGVTQAEAHILAHLAERDSCTVADLHEALAHKRSTLTSILDRLVARDLVRRDVSAADRRSFDIALTRSGRRVADRVHAALESLERAVLASSSKAAVEAALQVLAAVEDRA